MNQALFDYIAASPTAYQAAEHTAELLMKAGFTELNENVPWKLRANGKYFVSRNGSSVIAFKTPESHFTGFMITASHSDSPCFKIKENALLSDGTHVRFAVEAYGGMIDSPWLDRPLSVAGRVVYETETGVASKTVDFKEITAIIPNLAIHMNRGVNSGMNFNASVDMLPLYGIGEYDFKKAVCEKAGIGEDKLLATDLFVYNPQPGVEWNGLIAAPRLDDLECAYTTLEGFLTAGKSQAVQVYCLFDNEEVGSTTKQGAAGTFLYDVLSRVCEAFGTDLREKTSSSFMLSCDNAHALHPNHPEVADKNHTVKMNGGVVIKYNANQKYTSDAVSAGIFKLICKQANVPYQLYANRADMGGGSTLGNIANTQVSLNTVDIGLAQLAMHSCFETAGAEDPAHMIAAVKAFLSIA